MPRLEDLLCSFWTSPSWARWFRCIVWTSEKGDDSTTPPTVRPSRFDHCVKDPVVDSSCSSSNPKNPAQPSDCKPGLKQVNFKKLQQRFLQHEGLGPTGPTQGHCVIPLPRSCANGISCLAPGLRRRAQKLQILTDSVSL